MTDDPLDQIPAFDRISIPAVLVNEGEDVAAILAAAGIIDAIALPVVVGDETDLSPGLLGDGFTSNPTGVLETGEQQQELLRPEPGAEREWSARDDRQPEARDSVTLPPAYGITPLAPVRRR